MKPNLSRRAFIKWLSAVGGAIAAKMAGLGASNTFSCYQTLYAGSTWIYSWNAF